MFELLYDKYWASPIRCGWACWAPFSCKRTNREKYNRMCFVPVCSRIHSSFDNAWNTTHHRLPLVPTSPVKQHTHPKYQHKYVKNVSARRATQHTWTAGLQQSYPKSEGGVLIALCVLCCLRKVSVESCAFAALNSSFVNLAAHHHSTMNCFIVGVLSNHQVESVLFSNEAVSVIFASP